MRKITVFLAFILILLSSCSQGVGKYTPPSGEYLLSCKMGESVYDVNIRLSDDMSARLYFPSESSLCDWYFTRSSDGTVKRFTSLGEESEVNNEYVNKIFSLVLDSHELVAHVSHEKISGRDVSVLETSDGATVYTDSQSGAPLRLVYKNMTVDIISRPQTDQSDP